MTLNVSVASHGEPHIHNEEMLTTVATQQHDGQSCSSRGTHTPALCTEYHREAMQAMGNQTWCDLL